MSKSNTKNKQGTPSHAPKSPQRSRTVKSDGTGVIEVRTQAEFERYLAGDQLVVVDFWASWCSPCRMMAPLFGKVAQQFSGQLRFLKVNVEQVPEVASAFGVRSIPTLIELRGTELINSRVGLVDENALAKMAQKAIDQREGLSLGQKIKRLFGREEREDKAAETVTSA